MVDWLFQILTERMEMNDGTNECRHDKWQLGMLNDYLLNISIVIQLVAWIVLSNAWLCIMLCSFFASSSFIHHFNLIGWTRSRSNRKDVSLKPSKPFIKYDKRESSCWLLENAIKTNNKNVSSWYNNNNDGLQTTEKKEAKPHYSDEHPKRQFDAYQMWFCR